jgi:cyclopropane-fatty-acyl-phospholipid synthase
MARPQVKPRRREREFVQPESPFQTHIERLLAEANIRIGGSRPWDINVHDQAFYPRVLTQGSLGLGESYMDGDWDAQALDETLYRLIDARLEERVRGLAMVWDNVRARLLNLQAKQRSFMVGQRHYDLGNDLYRAMLGPRMIYSCGYWRKPDGSEVADLDAAQEAKLDLVFRKLGLQPGQRVLDIGCGWGGALRYAAECYGVSGVGVTISQEQVEYAREHCAGWPIEIRLQDYRDLDERFDRIFSIGMFEHVGVRNYRQYFQVVRRCLSEQGLFLLHTIGNDESVTHTDPWIDRYIFPNSMLPSPAQIGQALEGLFVIEDWHNFGADYDRTLRAWWENIECAWPTLDERYDHRFRRMWRFYLASSMAVFRCRRAQLWQLVLSPHGVPGGYIAPR